MNGYEPILKDKYEAVVIGAGVGGLSCATVLALEGVDVLVLEQSQRPGGCCSSFRVGDFTFDSAASVLQGFGEVGFHVLRTLFDFAGQQIELIPRESAYRLYTGEEHVDFFRDRNAFTSELGAMFPQQAGSLLALLRALEAVYHAVLDCSGPLRPRNDESGRERMALSSRHPVSHMAASRNTRISAEQLVRKFVDDPAVLAFLDADLTYSTGYRLQELTAAQAALTIMDRIVGGTHYPIGSSQQLPDRLEKSIVEHGGTVVYGAPVRRILLDGQRAAGVRLEEGRAVRAEMVIANTQAAALFGELLGAQHLRPQTAQWLDSLQPTGSLMAVFLGVAEEVVPEGFNPTTLLVDDPLRNPGRFIAINVPSLFDPNLAPEGFHSMTIHATTDAALWPRSASAEYGQPQYQGQKEDEAAKVLQRVEQLLPGVTGATVRAVTASPATFERYNRRSACAAARAPEALAPASLPGSVTEVPGLFLAGDSTFYGKGVAESTASGINCALVASRYLGIRPPRFQAIRGESYVMETVPVRPEISGVDVVDTLSAVLEAHRCMRCEDAPCRAACPAAIDIPTFVRRTAAGDEAGAAQTIRESNPFGEVCGIICPADRLCERACNRNQMDSAVRIAQLEAYACAAPESWPPPYRGARAERVAVVGSGPAGASCAYYLSQLGYSVEVFESAIDAGGLPAHAIPRTRVSPQVVEREVEGSLASGIEFRGNLTFGDDINFESLWREGFSAIFLGAGLQHMRMPEIAGVELPGVIDALSFLLAARRRVKRELTPRVAVLGEGTFALDCALMALDMGTERVFLVSPSNQQELLGGSAGRAVEQAVERGLMLLTERRATEIAGEGRVERVRTAGLSSEAPDFAEEGEVEGGGSIQVGAVIVAGLQVPDEQLAQFLAGQLRSNPDGTVLVDEETLATSRLGVFAGGELARGRGLVVDAVADGRRAALSIDRYLRDSDRRPGPPVQDSVED